MKVVREHYLRDDLWCGSALCRQCGNENSKVLETAPNMANALCDFPHYVVLDTNVVLHQVKTSHTYYVLMCYKLSISA